MKQLKYYADFETKQNNANGGQIGRKYFDKLPKDTYYAEGFQDANDKGKAYLFCLDHSTQLKPIYYTDTNIQVSKQY